MLSVAAMRQEERIRKKTLRRRRKSGEVFDRGERKVRDQGEG